MREIKTIQVPDIISTSCFKNSLPESTNKAAHKSGCASWLDSLTGQGKFFNDFSLPDNLMQENEITKKDLEEVPVLDIERNQIINAKIKLEQDRFLNESDKELIWSCLSLVRLNFKRIANFAASNKPSSESASYQWEMNWKHTRSEVNQVYEAARLMHLDRDETRDAIIASIFSDAVKDRHNFLVHNIDGSKAAACALSQLLDRDSPQTKKTITRITRAIKEHQVAPPHFMAQVVAIQLFRLLDGNAKAISGAQASDVTDQNAETLQTINSLCAKISKPFLLTNLTANGQKINFNKKERRLLKDLQITDWFVPHPDRNKSKISKAVIAGDHCINYNHPEGFAKIALLRGPNTDPLFNDDTIYTSLASAVASFSDSYEVLTPEIQPMAIAGLRRTQKAVERVIAIMREIVNSIATDGISIFVDSKIDFSVRFVDQAKRKHPDLFKSTQPATSDLSEAHRSKAMAQAAKILQGWFELEGEVPFEVTEQKSPGDRRRLPYWNAPLAYAPRLANGYYDVSKFSDLEERQYAFAQKIREIAVELLRAEEWIL
jgi:hypothetical protein